MPFIFQVFSQIFQNLLVKPKLKSEKKSNWEIGFKKISKLATFVIQGKNTRPTKQKKNHQEDLKATKGWAFYSASIIMDLVGEQKICGQNLDSF